MENRRAERWPTWAWVLFALQVATLLIALVPWIVMASGMMGSGMMRMMDLQPTLPR